MPEERDVEAALDNRGFDAVQLDAAEPHGVERDDEYWHHPGGGVGEPGSALAIVEP